MNAAAEEALEPCASASQIEAVVIEEHILDSCVEGGIGDRGTHC